MTEPTSLSTPKSQSDEAEPSNANLPTQNPVAIKLSDIPHFTQSKPNQNPTRLKSPSLEPSSCEGMPDEIPPKYEYEFSCVVDGRCSFTYLYDSSDRSACERVTHRPLKAEDITYSDTGNGFVTSRLGLHLTFTKQPYKNSWETHADIKAGVQHEKRKQQTAVDILAEL